MASDPTIGVVIVTFNAADVIRDCLEGLMASETPLHIVVVDNASPDNTVAVIRSWATGQEAYAPPQALPFLSAAPCSKPVAIYEAEPGGPVDPGTRLCLLHAGQNNGFAAGVNLGLAYLSALPEIAHFWVLNPDGIATAQAASAFLARAQDRPDYGLLGGRVCYVDPFDIIQIDGGRINHWTGTTGNFGSGQPNTKTPGPDEEALDFITGASMMVSRAFLDAAGPMPEDYFLYYEEVDWATRRGQLPMLYAPGALVYHHAGTAIGSHKLGGIASPFSIYFKYRSQMRFVARRRPTRLPLTYLYILAKSVQFALRGAGPGARAALAALHGLPAPAAIAARLSPEARAVALTPWWRRSRSSTQTHSQSIL